MPSFTDHDGDSGSELPGLQPILGTGLLSSFPKVSNGTGNGSSTMTSISDGQDGHTPRKHRASVGKKTTARPALHNIKSEPAVLDEAENIVKPAADDPQDGLFSQVYEWLQREKAKQRTHRSHASDAGTENALESDGDDDDDYNNEPAVSTAPRIKAMALGRLEKILLEYAASRCESSNTSVSSVRRSGRRRNTVKGLRRGSASESDQTEVEYGVPAVDAVLDNSKTLAYSGGAGDDEDGTTADAKRAKDKEAWVTFKTEIVRLAHTLQLKGWRKFPMESACDIGVVRLSGALTNAVYVVTPPATLPPPPKAEDGSYTLVPRRAPPKLLLRIYGPQVEHLIDREKELQILRRLGRKNIGPRVLGTFNNGRFEQYFEARTLTPEDLRYPETMKQIAKRMRELHEGIELEEDEREGGPMVIRNWDKWVDRCEQVVSWLDMEIQSERNEVKAQAEPWRRRGFVCGVPWPAFRKAVDRYRRFLEDSCGGVEEIKRQLVFAHNDTQYGNLLRLEPRSESPLLLPANEHKQLVVIDFEYASANTPGFEFANHFSEWCYNYLDPGISWYFDINRYPTPQQQHQFISAYVSHRPALTGQGASPISTPIMRGALSSSTSTTTNPTPPPAPAFNLDDTSSAQNQTESEKVAEDMHEKEVQFFMTQTRLWRVINSAQWVAWGVVQAKVPGMEEDPPVQGEQGQAAQESNGHDSGNGYCNGHSNGSGNGHYHEDSASAATESETETANTPPADEDGFDYLAYAQDRAMMFWADMYALKLVSEDELPREIVEHIKTRVLEY